MIINMPAERLKFEGKTFRLRRKFEKKRDAEKAKKKLKKTMLVRIISYKDSKGRQRHGLYARGK